MLTKRTKKVKVRTSLMLAPAAHAKLKRLAKVYDRSMGAVLEQIIKDAK